jgi:uncharacterized protein (UPF0548 family)
VRPPSTPLADRPLSYGPAGLTLRPLGPAPPGFRAFQTRVAIGAGDACWRRARHDVLRWAVKTRSGFAVEPAGPVVAGSDCRLRTRIGPVTIREPVRVVGVVDEPARAGFAYGTLPGHPVSGEESFAVERDPAGTVWLVLRSLTRPAPGPRGLLFPGALVAQRVYRRRYLRSLA